MAVSHSDIDSFYVFARAHIDANGAESMHDLFDMYLLEHPSEVEQQEVREAIDRGLADMQAGRVRPADDVLAELRQKYGMKQA